MMWYLLSAIIGGLVGGWSVLILQDVFNDNPDEDPEQDEHTAQAAATVARWGGQAKSKGPVNRPAGDWRNAAQEVDKQEMGAIKPDDISSTTVKIDASDLNWGVTSPCGVMVDDPWAEHNKIHHIEGRHDH